MGFDRRILIERTRDVVTSRLRSLPVRIYLFGSFASGTESRGSDIDVAIDSDHPLPPGVLARLHDRWLLGRDAEPHRPRWSVLRDVLGWRDARDDLTTPPAS